MVKTGTEEVQERDRPVQAKEGSFPWRPRVDDKRAVLVTERSAVFDRLAEVPPAPAPIEDIRDPIWDHKHGRVWTPDLVHCRLLNVGDTIARLPSPMKRGYVSLLGDILLDDGREVRRPPTAAEISVADWTWSELIKRPATQRCLLQAMAFGASVRTVSKLLARTGTKVQKSTVANWYLSERRALAGTWQASRHLVDGSAFERWRGLFEKEAK